MTFTEFWPQCLLHLQQNLPAQQYQMWIAPLTVGEEDGKWVLFARNTFTFNHVRDRFWPAIEDACLAVNADSNLPLILKIGQGQLLQAAAKSDSTPAQTKPASEPEVNDVVASIASPQNSKPPVELKSTVSAQDIIAKRLRNHPSKTVPNTDHSEDHTAKGKPPKLSLIHI